MRFTLGLLASTLAATLFALATPSSNAVGMANSPFPSGDYVAFSPSTVARTCSNGVGVTRISMQVPYDTTHLHTSLPLSGAMLFYNRADPNATTTFLQGDVEVAIPGGRVGTQLFEFDVPASDASYDEGQIFISGGPTGSYTVAEQRFPMQCGSAPPMSVTLPALKRNNICDDVYMKVDNRLGTMTWYDYNSLISVGPRQVGTMPISPSTSTFPGGFQIATVDSTGHNAVWVMPTLGSPPCQLGVFSVVRPGSISGTLRVGYRLYAHPSSTRVPATHLSYRWLRNGAAIIGATATSYLLRAVDRHQFISVRITYSRAGYRTWTQILRAMRPIT